MKATQKTLIGILESTSLIGMIGVVTGPAWAISRVVIDYANGQLHAWSFYAGLLGVSVPFLVVLLTLVVRDKPTPSMTMPGNGTSQIH